MKKHKFLFLLFHLLLLAAFSACSSSTNATSNAHEDDPKVCPKCHMPLQTSNLYSAKLIHENKVHYFDDIGCMILWTKEKDILLKNNAQVFTRDTQKYIDADKAQYKINDTTPMMYGFSAYETQENDQIAFDEVILRMLRGENMTNPKIRKQLLKN